MIMDMKHFVNMFAAASLVALASLSCAKEKEPAGNGEETKNKVTISATLPEELGTKVTFTEGEAALKLSWETTDVLRIISESGESETYTVKEINGRTATFEGYELEGTKFTAIYPGNYETVEAIEAHSYTGQVQAGNASTAHLQLNAMAAELPDIQNISFAGEGVRLNGALKLCLNLPETVAKVSGVTLSAASDIFFTDNAGSAKSSSFGLSLENADVSESHVLTAYMMSPWAEAAITEGTELTVTVEADGAAIKKSFTTESAVNLAGGYMSTIQINDGDWTAVLGGSGTEADPYRLSTVLDLLAMKPVLAAGQTTYFKMISDIDMGSIDNWTPLNQDEPYDLGIDFDGDGHSLLNLKSKEVKYASFFGVLYGNCHNVKFENAEIVGDAKSGAGIVGGYIGTGGKPAHVYDVEATGTVTNSGKGQNVGGLGGNAREAAIERCSVNVVVSNPMGDGTRDGRTSTGGIVGKTLASVSIIGCVSMGTVETTNGTSNTYTGGIVGYESAVGAEIRDCESHMTVSSAGERVGGIVGHYQGGTLSGCKFYGDVNATRQYAGGIAGIVSEASTIEGCFSSGTVMGQNKSGGIVGMNENSLTIRRCGSSSTIKCTDDVGGILGFAPNGKAATVEDCVFSGKMTVGQRTGGIVGDMGSGSSVARCYVSGAITGWAAVGGLVGRAAGISWNAKDKGYDNTIESCIAWFDNITATRNDENGGGSGIIVGFTGLKNILKDCIRKPEATLTAKYCSDVYDQENADAATPLSIREVPSKYTFIYPYHGKAAASDATASGVARSLGWSSDVWDLSGSEPKLK